MADCITTTAHTSPVMGFIERIRRASARAHDRRMERKGLRQMLELDDNALRDIGVTRGDIAYAAGRPASEDLSRTLCKLSKRGNLW